MSKIIYVQQGNSARLSKTSMPYDIVGLFTDGFSSCNIIACRTDDKLVLMHIDTQTIISPVMKHKIVEELKWIGNVARVEVYYRKADEANGEHVLNELLVLFGREKIKPHTQITPLEKGGVYLSFNGVELFAKDIQPDNLIHHPQEQQFTAVQKITQIVGVIDISKTQAHRVKTLNIFDGLAWQTITKSDLEIDISGRETKMDMEYFLQTDPCIAVAQKILDIRLNNIKHGIIMLDKDTPEAPMEIAFYMEGYLNGFDKAASFKQNIDYLIRGYGALTPESPEDVKFKADIELVLKKSGDIFAEVQNIIEQYTQNAPNTKYKTDNLMVYQMFYDHYEKRRYFDSIGLERVDIKTNAIEKSKKAIESFLAKDFQTSSDLFLDVVKNLSYCCVNSDALLATAYYNYGRSLFCLGKHEEASIFLGISLNLRENYTLPKPEIAQLEKTRKALLECGSNQANIGFKFKM